MALYTGFFNSNPEAGLVRKYDAEDISRLFDGLIGDGVLETVGDKLIVKPNNGMIVSVGTGRAWFSHCWIRNDSKLDLTVPESDPLLPRKDTVVLEVNHNLNVLDCSIKIITGAPAAVPKAATLEDTEYIKQVPLAYISVAAGATEIVITDLTNCVGTSACPFVIGIASFMTIDDFVAQWGAEWTAWLAAKGTQYDNMFTAKSEQFDAWFLAKNDAWTDFMAEKNTEWTAWLAQQSTTLQNIQNEINSFTETLITGVMCTDVNETFDTGNYGINAQTQGTLPTGVSAGSMEVINSPSGNTKQVLYPDSGENIIYTRSYDSTTEAWSTWKAASGGGGGGTAGGSIINVTTTETSLRNKNVTITNGTETASATFDGNGVAVIEGFTGVGSCTISASDGYLTGQKSITIPYFGNYTETLSLWKATVTITVQDAYDGQTVEIYDEHMDPIAAVDCTAAAGGATWTANTPGTYIFSVQIGTYPDVTTVDASRTITDEGEYDVTLTSYKVYGFSYDSSGANNRSGKSPDELISYDIQYNGKDVVNKDFTPLTRTNAYSDDNPWKDAFFMPKVVGINFDDGAEATAEVTFDGQTQYKIRALNGTTNILNEDRRQIMVKFPKIWIKTEYVNNGGQVNVYIADRKLDDDFYAWAYKGPNNVEYDSVYVGAFFNTYLTHSGDTVTVSDDQKSIPSDSGRGFNRDLSRARANDSYCGGKYKWDLYSWQAHSMISILSLLVSKTTDSQTAFGGGLSGDSAAHLDTASSLIESALSGRQLTYPYTGDNMRWLFYGAPLSDNKHVRCFGVEDLWGNVYCYLGAAHCFSNSGTMIMMENYPGEAGSIMDNWKWIFGSRASGMITSGYCGKIVFDQGLIVGVYTASGGSSSTECCDYHSGGGSNNGAPAVGGRTTKGESNGLFMMAADAAGQGQDLSWWGGTRNMCWKIEEATNV